MWALTRHESIGALVVNAFEFDEHYIGCIAIKEVLVGGSQYFGDIETCSSVWYLSLFFMLCLYLYAFDFNVLAYLGYHAHYVEMQYLLDLW